MFKLFSNHFSLIVAVIFLSSVCSSRQTLPTVRLGGQSSTPSKAQLPDEYRKLQIGFEQNFGQTDGRVRFLSRGGGYNLFLTNTEAVLSAKGSNNTQTFRMNLIGANSTPAIEGIDRLPGSANYLKGDDPKAWRKNIPRFARVQYRDVYPGIDLIYYDNREKLEYDFVVRPGADPEVIRLKIDGSESMAIDASGNLVLDTQQGRLQQHKPVVFQQKNGERWLIDGSYAINPGGEISFELAGYDRSKPLIIDPVLSYSTYLGGSGAEQANGVAVDSSGNAYITGVTLSANFPVANPFQQNLAKDAGGGDTADVFVAKLNAAGTALVYSTYLGGDQYDQGSGIAVDANGSACVAGYTQSDNFPVEKALYPNHPHGVFDEEGFITKLSPSGDSLAYSTHLGGMFDDRCNGIAVDSANNVCVTGQTVSPDFPLASPLFARCNCTTREAFVAKINASGSSLIYSTYLGGAGGVRGGNDTGTAIAVDSGGNAYVTGATSSSDFPVANAFDPSFNDDLSQGFELTDAFVTKINAQGSAMVYSTFLGGNGSDEGKAIAVDSAGNAYVAGVVRSNGFPTTPGAFQPGYLGPATAPASFVTKFNASGSQLVYSTFLDGDSFDTITGIAVDRDGFAYVAGGTLSRTFPVANPIQPALKIGQFSNSDAFVTKLNQTGSALVYSTFFGGTGDESAFGIAVDSSGSVYIAGETRSSDLPTLNPIRSGIAGINDAFVARIDEPDRNPGTVTVFGPGPFEGVLSDKPITIRYAGSDPDGLSGFIVSYSLDGGQVFHDIARVGPLVNEIIWNAPDPLIAQAVFRVTAVDRLGNTFSALGNTFRLSPSFFLIPPTLKVNLLFEPPPQGVVVPPQNVRFTLREMSGSELPIAFNQITNRSLWPPKLAGYNVYRMALPGAGQPLPPPQVITSPTNLVGSIDIDATTFVDIVGTNRGDNFIYSITTFAGDGGVSSGSQPVNTSLPVIINPTWIGKTVLLQEPGSFIAHSGAMLTVNGNAAFPLELDESMHLFRVPKNEHGSNDRKIKRTIKLNREVFLTVTNPDGTTSVAKMFTRRE